MKFIFLHVAFIAFMGLLFAAAEVEADEAKAETGVTESTILIGTSYNKSGPSSERSLEIKRGHELVFAKVNKSGGIHGRKIEVIALDDAYDPKRSIDNAQAMINKEKVFLLFGFFGAANSKAVLPLVQQAGIPFFAPTAAVEALFTPPKKCVFGLRPTYAQEVVPLIRYLLGKNLKEIAVFYQDDSVGQEALVGVQKTLAKSGIKLSISASHDRNSENVDGAVKTIMSKNPQAIVLSAVAKPAVAFIKKARAAGFTGQFVGATTLASAGFIRDAGVDAEGVIISNGYPPGEGNAPLVLRMKDDQKALGFQGTVHVEGYLSASVLVEILKRAGKDLTRDRFCTAVQDMSYFDAGGVKISFSPENHQGLQEPILSIVKGGKFVLL